MLRKIFNLLIIISAGLIIIYDRYVEPLDLWISFLPLLAFSLQSLIFYQKVHKTFYFHVFALSTMIIYFISTFIITDNFALEQYISIFYFLIPVTFMIFSMIVFDRIFDRKAIDRHIKIIFNISLFIYALWTIIFASGLTNVLLDIITKFKGPHTPAISQGIAVFWQISRLTYIFVWVIQVYMIFRFDLELSYRNIKNIELKEHEKEFKAQFKDNQKDIFGYKKGDYEKKH